MSRPPSAQGGSPFSAPRMEVTRQLAQALRPFVTWLDKLEPEFNDHDDDIIVGGRNGAFVTFGDLRAARAALKEYEKP